MQISIDSSIEEWQNLPWKKFEAIVFRLQHRIYKASKKRDYKLIHKLQKCLINSKAIKYLGIRQITEFQYSKYNKLIPKLQPIAYKYKVELIKEINNLKKYKHGKLKRMRRIIIGKHKYYISMPNIKDHIIQYMMQQIIEPVYESYASKGNFGYRHFRSPWDVQKSIMYHLIAKNDGFQKTIILLDLEKCFENIDREKLIKKLIIPNQGKKIIRSALKAGILENVAPISEGLPEANIIRPLLCNLALHGLEDLNNNLDLNKKNNEMQKGVRYGYQTVFFVNTENETEKLLKSIDQFLQEIGLKLQDATIKIVPSIEGFDFLGWHFKVKAKNHKFTSYPAKDNRRKMINKIKKIMKDTRFNLDERLNIAKTIYRNWCKYHIYTDIRQINRWSICHWIYKYSKKLIYKRNRNNRAIAKQYLISKIKEIYNNNKFARLNQYIKINNNKSIYDNDFTYWHSLKLMKHNQLSSRY
jgi:RNA-directed DNA polymerase